MSIRMRFSSWLVKAVVPMVFRPVNPLARWLLRSPLHPLMSWYVMLLYVEGRRSGRRYTLPVAYHRAEDGSIEVLTGRVRQWWRNLSDDREITILLKGAERRARVEVVLEDSDAMNKALRARDIARRLLLPALPEETVLLRIHVLPEARS